MGDIPFHPLAPIVSGSCQTAKCMQFNFKSPHRLLSLNTAYKSLLRLKAIYNPLKNEKARYKFQQVVVQNIHYCSEREDSKNSKKTLNQRARLKPIRGNCSLAPCPRSKGFGDSSPPALLPAMCNIHLLGWFHSLCAALWGSYFTALTSPNISSTPLHHLFKIKG